MISITFLILSIALINLNQSWLSKEYVFYINLIFTWVLISAQQIEQGFFHRRTMLYTYFKADSRFLHWFKGGIILSAFQIMKAFPMALLLSSVFMTFYHLMWVAMVLFAIAFFLLKAFYLRQFSKSIYDVFRDQMAQTLTRWTLMPLHLALFFFLQMNQQMDDVTGMSLIQALEHFSKDHQFQYIPAIGSLLQYLEASHHIAIWAIQNLNVKAIMSEQLLKSILIGWFCLSSVFYTWFLLYFYAGLCIGIDLKSAQMRLNQLDHRYLDEL